MSGVSGAERKEGTARTTNKMPLIPPNLTTVLLSNVRLPFIMLKIARARILYDRLHSCDSRKYDKGRAGAPKDPGLVGAVSLAELVEWHPLHLSAGPNSPHIFRGSRLLPRRLPPCRSYSRSARGSVARPLRTLLSSESVQDGPGVPASRCKYGTRGLCPRDRRHWRPPEPLRPRRGPGGWDALRVRRALAQTNDGPVLAAPKSAKSRRRIKSSRAPPWRPSSATGLPRTPRGSGSGESGRIVASSSQPHRRLPEPLPADRGHAQEPPGACRTTLYPLPRPPAYVRHDPALARRPRQARPGVTGSRYHQHHPRHLLPCTPRHRRRPGRRDGRRPRIEARGPGGVKRGVKRPR